MSSNIYRFSIIGETLTETLTELGENYRVSEEIKERVMEKFDEIANKNICREINIRERERYDLTPVHIVATEHEFKFHDGVWSLILKDVNIKNEWLEMNLEALKVIAVNLDNNVKRRKRIGKKKLHK